MLNLHTGDRELVYGRDRSQWLLCHSPVSFNKGMIFHMYVYDFSKYIYSYYFLGLIYIICLLGLLFEGLKCNLK